MKKAINGTAVHFTFDDGLASIVFESTKASDKARDYAEMHGWEARIGDMAAISRKQKDGTVITITEQMRRDAILAGVTHYESGTEEWGMKGGIRAAPQNAVFLAIAAKRGITYEEAMAAVQVEMLGELAE